MTSAGPVPTDGLPLLTGAQAGAADEAAVAAGDTWDGLLARAGAALARGVVEVLRERTGGVYGRRALVVVGKGDNGGDGWVCAARLRERGVAVTVLAPHGTDVETSPHTDRARSAWLSAGGRVRHDGATHLDRVLRPADRDLPDVTVDCVLGTGAHGAPRPGPAADGVRVLRALADVGVPVVACDVPSGVDADTGRVDDEDLAVRADLTVTFGGAKRGLVLSPGADRVGTLRVADLGPHWSVPDVADHDIWVATGDGSAVPRAWAPDADKRARGRVLVVAGSRRYGGAAALCGWAALRTGAGLVTVATTADPGPVLARDPGLMVRSLPVSEDAIGGPAASAIDDVVAALDDTDAAVVGPGLGHEPPTREVVEAVLSARPDGPMRRTVVLDADGCNVFRDDLAGLVDATDDRVRLVLTPHERELARLLDVEVPVTAADRVDAAREVAERTGAIVLAKGPATVVVGPGQPTYVVTSGGPALGTGGTGDVLAGMLGAVLARDHWHGEADVRPVAGAAHLHGLAGALAGARTAGRATASDVVTALPDVLAALAASAAQRGTGS